MAGTGTDNARSAFTIWRKVAYACGNAGVILTYQLLTTSVLSYYQPPAGKGATLMPAFLLGVIPTYLVLNVLARGIDTFFDPWIANRSDRSTSRFGRRRVFLMVGCLPMALCTALIFVPLSGEPSTLNVVTLGVLLTAYYCFFSVYAAPYLALLPELCPDKHDNTVVSTMLAAAALFAAIAVTTAPAFFISATDVDRSPMRTMAFVISGFAFVLMVMPVLFVDERKLVDRAAAGPASHLGLIDSLKATFRDRAFVPYVLGYTLFFFGFNIVQTGAPFYVEVLLRESLDKQIMVLGPMFGVAAATFPFIAVLVRRFGKRVVMAVGGSTLALLLFTLPLLHDLVPAMIVFAFCGFGVGIFLAVPNAILADVCEANARRTGERREAMFFGAQGFLQKISLGVSTGIFGATKDLFGSSVDNPLGVQLSGPIAGVVILLAVVCFLRYPEQRINTENSAAASA